MADAADEFAALLERARHGEESALAAVAEYYAAPVRRAARVLLGPALRPHLDSMDLLQSVHRILLAGLRQNKFDINSPNQLVVLALMLLRRKVARHWRQLKHQPGSNHAMTGDQFAQLLATLTHPDLGPESAAQDRDEINHFLDSLDETDRALIELRLQGHSTADAARELGLDARLLRVRLMRLRKRLEARGLQGEWF